MSNPEKLNVLASDCERAAKTLKGAFVWAASEEGLDYWLEVYKKLLDMASATTPDEREE